VLLDVVRRSLVVNDAVELCEVDEDVIVPAARVAAVSTWWDLSLPTESLRVGPTPQESLS